MRALLIILLGCSLIWLVLQGFRRVRAGDDASEAGVLLPMSAPIEARPAEADVKPSVPASPPSVVPPPVVAQAAAAAHLAEKPPEQAIAIPSESPASRIQRNEESTPSPADELALASILFRRPQDVPAYLEGDGKSLPAGRRALGLALCRLVLGPQDEARRMAEDLESRDGVRVAELAYLKQGLSAAPNPIPAASSRESALLLAASLARRAREGDEALAAGKSRDAALAFGEVILGEVCGPWKPERDSLRVWSDALARAQVGYRWNRDGGWAFIEEKVGGGDSLISVRKRILDHHPDLLLCTGLIERANGLRGSVLHPGQQLRIPAARASVLVDVDARWALYRLDDEVVAAWEIGVGKPGNETPHGLYQAGEKTQEPMWFRPGHEPVPFGDPENPLGTRWIAWQRQDGSTTGLGFHGTKDPASIGEDLSQGCVRMRREAIEELFEILPRGARIVVQP